MKPPPLDYLRPSSLSEAIEVLAGDEDAKVLSGGQSLMPLLALRLARPTVLVDLADVGLAEIELTSVDCGGKGAVTVGALVRQRRLELDADLIDAVPLLADAVAQVGYPATRNRGTIGGSLAHADPVAELPAVAVALGAHVVAVGPTGAREIACADLATGYFTTVLDPAEILTEVHFPGRADWHGAAWHEWSPRAHDFAVAGVGVAVDLDAAGTCVAVHAAACGIGGAPLPLTEVIAAAGVLGWSPTSAATGDQSPGKAAEVPAALWRAVAAAVMVACGGAEVDQVELTGLLAARAVRSALARAAQNLGKGRQ